MFFPSVFGNIFCSSIRLTNPDLFNRSHVHTAEISHGMNRSNFLFFKLVEVKNEGSDMKMNRG